MDNRVRRRVLGLASAVGAWVAVRGVLRATRAMNFRDRVVLITGGSRGLGLVLARKFVAKGAKVAICARDADELQRAVDDLQGRGGRVFAATCDVTVEDEIHECVARVTNTFGPIDVLINNAGVLTVGPVESMTIPDFQDSMETHFWGPLHFMLSVIPSMMERGTGRIVNISSFGGLIGVPHLVPYCSGKFALTGLSDSLRTELIRYGVYVTTICPGLMRTGSHVNVEFKGGDPQEHAWFTLVNALPLTSMSCDRAADQILRACANGDAQVVLSLPYKVLRMAHHLMPNISAEVLAAVARVLPDGGKVSPMTTRGSEIKSPMSSSIWTSLADKASRENNELHEMDDDDQVH